jgi:hypothetical protein
MHRRRTAFAALAGALAAGMVGALRAAPSLGSALPTSPSGKAAERVIDRTFRCNVGLQGGIEKIEVTAQRGVRAKGKTKWFAQAGIVTFEEGDLREKNSLFVVGMTAGWPPPPPPPPVSVGGFGVSLEQCTPVVARVPLTHRGLNGGLANPFGDKYECFPPKKILLRTRAVFRSSTSLRFDARGGRSLQARGRITHGIIVAATLKGKPIVYTEIFEAGKAFLFTRPDCVEDTT